MNAAIAKARAYGVPIAFADLGAWGDAELRSEYDPREREIRINAGYAQALHPSQLGTFVTLAIGHELYHHRENIGEIPAISDRAERERAATDYALALLHESA